MVLLGFAEGDSRNKAREGSGQEGYGEEFHCGLKCCVGLGWLGLMSE